MLKLSDPVAVRGECEKQRRAGKRIGFVPTMGFLHEGHLSLIRRAHELSDYVVVSIFVNPTQFGPQEDLSRYPRDIDGDLQKCVAENVSMVFLPTAEQMYPAGHQTYVDVEELSRGLCGQRRPGHFRGVATVVAKLFNIVGECSAVFGEKDYQQLQVIKQLTRDLNMPVQIVGHPTVRESDGLAMSSRNAYLSVEERRQAICLFRALKEVEKEYQQRDVELIVDEAIRICRKIIEAEPSAKIDYIEIRHAQTLLPLEKIKRGDPSVIAMAVFLGKTRLIDNIHFE